jgi:hypothetical protein
VALTMSLPSQTTTYCVEIVDREDYREVSVWHEAETDGQRTPICGHGDRTNTIPLHSLVHLASQDMLMDHAYRNPIPR